MTTTDELQTSPYTLPAGSIEAGYILMIMLGTCYLDEFRQSHSTTGQRVICFYNFALSVAYFIMTTYLWGVHGSANMEPGTLHHDQEGMIKIFALSRITQLLDTGIVFYRGDRSRLTFAHVLHNSTVLVLWSLVVDNTTIADAGYRLIAALHSSALTLYHLHFVFATYGKCTYPLSYVLTTICVANHVASGVVACVMAYKAHSDNYQARLIVASAWITYSCIMIPLTLPFMWKKRLNQCWPTRNDRLNERTVGEVV